MDDELLNEITTQVLRVLEGMEEDVEGGEGLATPSVLGKGPRCKGHKKVLLCTGEGEGVGEQGEVLSQSELDEVKRWCRLEEVEWYLYPGNQPSYARGYGITGLHFVRSIKDIQVYSFDAIVVLGLSLGLLCRISNLMVNDPVVYVVVEGLIQGVSVFALDTHLQRYKFYSGRIPSGILTVVNGHIRNVEKMGVEILGATSLIERLTGCLRMPEKGRHQQGKRDVITLDDLNPILGGSSKILEVTPGTIITPLARQALEEAGIEVKYR